MLHISDNLQLSSFPLKSSTADLAMTKDQMMKELCVLGIHTRHSGRLCHDLTEFLIRACPRSRTQFTVLLRSSNPRHIKAFQQWEKEEFFLTYIPVQISTERMCASLPG